MNGLRQLLYQLASILGWINAAEKGPSALVRRGIRVGAYKGTSRIINRLTRPSRGRKSKDYF